MKMGSQFSRQPRQIHAVHWVVLAIVTLLTILVIVIPIILFMLNKNGYTLVPTAGFLPISYAWKCMLHYFFPKELQDYELAKEKIWAKAWSRQKMPKP